MITIKDVAKEAGVSIATVSFVINEKSEQEKISLQTQERVWKAVEKLGYVPSKAARSMRSKLHIPSLTIGVYWVKDARFKYLDRLMEGFHRGCVDFFSIPVQLVITPYTPNELCKDKNLYTNYKYDYAIIVNTTYEDLNFLNTHIPAIPTILFNRHLSSYPCAYVDNEKIIQKAVELLEKSGVKQLGMLLNRDYVLGMDQRRQFLLEKLSHSSIELCQDFIYCDETTVAAGVSIGEKILRSDYLPDGFFCATDDMAQGLIYSLTKGGISIPQDVKILAVGMRSPNISTYMNPSISLVKLPLEDLAYECMHLIHNHHSKAKECLTSRELPFDVFMGDTLG